MSEIKNIDEDHEDSMEPGELKVTPPGTPTLNSDEPLKGNDDKGKNDGGNEQIKSENGKSLSSLEILKTYQDQEDDRYMSVPDMPNNAFFDGNFAIPHSGPMIMAPRGFPLFRGVNRGVSVKARLGFRGAHRGAFFPGRGRGFVRRNSMELRDLNQEVKPHFKIKLMYTKTKPSLSWHPNPNYTTIQKLDLSKTKAFDKTKSSDSKVEEKSPIVADKKKYQNDDNENRSSKVRDKKSLNYSTEKDKSKESKSKKKDVKERKELKKKHRTDSKDRDKDEKRKEKDYIRKKSDKDENEKSCNERKNEKPNKK
ncbi:uncharacterized protein LOC129605697, partial [Condylostylus longicornis]|uniref:uncharacterized protein LOC129605697 n=1 Tax=Condylostylus longicornis TaxID=2530218 RepID=UPI00244E37DB